MSEDSLTGSGGYILGHSAQELARLNAQARLVEPITRRFFQEAGIGAGMRVLDVGSGAGDVALLAAELVGSSGTVVGVDPLPGGGNDRRDKGDWRVAEQHFLSGGRPSPDGVRAPLRRGGWPLSPASSSHSWKAVAVSLGLPRMNFDRFRRVSPLGWLGAQREGLPHGCDQALGTPRCAKARRGGPSR